MPACLQCLTLYSYVAVLKIRFRVAFSEFLHPTVLELVFYIQDCWSKKLKNVDKYTGTFQPVWFSSLCVDVAVKE